MSPEAAVVQKHPDDGEVRVERDIDTTQQQRAITTDIKTQAGTAPSPWQDTLPDDILIHIFVLISQDHGPVVFPIQIDHERLAPPQFILSHVCSRWRTLALNTFELWNSVQLDDIMASPPGCEWLSWAGSSPVELSLRFVGSTLEDAILDDGTPVVASVVQDIVSHFKPHVKMLHMELTFHQFKALSNIPDTILSHVEELELEFNAINVRETFSIAPISFTRLRAVSLRDAYDSVSLNSNVLPNLSLPWSQLRGLGLNLNARDLIPFMDTLRQMPLIQDLYLGVQSHSSDCLAPLKNLTIPSMRRIELDLQFAHEDTHQVIRNITFPALIGLDMASMGCSKETYEILKQQYNLQELESLSFPECAIPASSILKDVPKLQSFWIRGDMDDEAIAGLSNGTLGRYLREFTTSASDVIHMNRLLSMVEMRKRTVDRLIEIGCNWREMITVLREVDLYTHDCSDKCKYKERVDALNEVGITVTLYYE